jgi:TPR repeat protein
MAVLERLVEQGHARAMTELGRLRLSSVGREANVSAALALFERAASLHDPEGTYLLGAGHRLELFSESDPDKGLELLRDAAGAGHLVAVKVLYSLEQSGEQTGVSTETFRTWLEANAATGDGETLMHLAYHYMSAGEVDRAVSVYETAAQAGEFYAFVALLQLTGTRLDLASVRQRVEETLRLYAESANGGGGPAGFLLAMMEALNGPDDPRVVERVRRRLEHAVARDSHKATVALAALDRGASLADAFEEAIANDHENAYLRRVENMPNPPDLDDKGMTMPRPTRTVRPIYPLELSVDHVEGVAVFDFIVGTDGNVGSIVCVETTHPAFARAGEVAIAQWKFTPGTKAGHPEPMRMRVPFRFSKTE